MERQIVQKLPFFQTVIGFLAEHPQKTQHLLIFIKLAQENPSYCNSPQLQEHEELRQKRLHMQSLWMWGKHLGICFKGWSIKKKQPFSEAGVCISTWSEAVCSFWLQSVEWGTDCKQHLLALIPVCTPTQSKKKHNTHGFNLLKPFSSISKVEIAQNPGIKGAREDRARIYYSATKTKYIEKLI